VNVRGLFVIGLSFLGASVALADPTSICDNTPTTNLVQNCGFELPYSGGAGTVPTDWTGAQFTTYEDVVTSPVNSGSQSLRIANNEFQGGEPLFDGAAILSQTISDVAGQNYILAFYLYNGMPNNGGSPNGSNEQFQAFWGSASDPTGGSPVFVDTGYVPSSWTEYLVSVVGTGSDTITFTSYNTPSYYYLDDVSVTVDPAPEPASLIPLALGMAGLVVAVRRRSRSKAV